MSERRHTSLRDVMVMVSLLMNFGALVWGAAKLSASVQSLQATTVKLDESVGGITRSISLIQIDYNSRMSVLEARMNTNEQEVNALNTKVRGY